MHCVSTNPLLLVFTHKITPRLSYIFKHIFVRILQLEVKFTTKVEEFVAHNGAKLTYSKAPLGKEFFIKNNSLLYEQGINDLTIQINKWDETPCFFPTGEFSSIPFDIFAASFYLLTRYEEYQPHVTDKNERFSATQSLAFENDFLEQPVVDVWANKLLTELQVKFPHLNTSPKAYEVISTINVNEAFAYKHKGILRNLAGYFKDIFNLNFRGIGRRTTVILRIKEDPFNTYSQILKIVKKAKIKVLFFFLFSEYTTNDTNISYTNRNYKLLIKSIIDYVPFGQLFSYYTIKSPRKLKKEKNNFELVVNRPITKSRQHKNRLEIPKTYQNLIDLDITEDYSMGYYTHIGFRASTCTPFYFYDLDYEIQTPLKILPFAINDAIFLDQKLTAKEAYLKIKTIEHEVKKVNGTFITIFHNTLLSDMQSNEQWRDLYAKTLINTN